MSLWPYYPKTYFQPDIFPPHLGQKQPEGSPPNFVQKPAIKQADNKITFECKLTGEPKPEITWTQGSKVITDGGRYKLTHLPDADGKTQNVSLEITGVGPDDGGEYKVHAKNNRGEANATINLNLAGIPSWA